MRADRQTFAQRNIIRRVNRAESREITLTTVSNKKQLANLTNFENPPVLAGTLLRAHEAFCPTMKKSLFAAAAEGCVGVRDGPAAARVFSPSDNSTPRGPPSVVNVTGRVLHPPNILPARAALRCPRRRTTVNGETSRDL